jgi:predicted RNA methylase
VTPSAYDLVPYPSLPYDHGHPDAVATLAWLLGHGADDAPTPQRIVDLGAGTGVHALAVATTMPDAEVVAVDASPRQVEALRARATALDLGVEAVHADITTWSPRQADHVACWGVLSWVSRDDAQRILQWLHAALPSHGTALLGLNTLPGWHMLGAVRDLLRFHTRRESAEGPAATVRKAREVLAFVTGVAVEEGGPWAHWLAESAALLDDAPDAYVLHEFLAPYNRAVLFREHLVELHDAGLDWLTEARHAATNPELFPQDVAALLAGEGERRRSALHVEQLMDFLRNKRFRATVAVPGRLPVPTARRRADHGRLRRVAVRLDATLAPQGARWLRSRQGHAVQAPRRWWAVFLALDEVAPRWVPWELLRDGARRRDPSVHDRDVDEALAWGLDHGLLDLRRQPPSIPDGPGERPRAVPLAAALAAEGPDVSGLLGDVVPLDEDARALLRDCDGTRHHEALAARWQARLPPDERLREDAVPAALTTLWRRGLLGHAS